jgi:hypothetical protein
MITKTPQLSLRVGANDGTQDCVNHLYQAAVAMATMVATTTARAMVFEARTEPDTLPVGGVGLATGGATGGVTGDVPGVRPKGIGAAVGATAVGTTAVGAAGAVGALGLTGAELVTSEVGARVVTAGIGVGTGAMVGSPA